MTDIPLPKDPLRRARTIQERARILEDKLRRTNDPVYANEIETALDALAEEKALIERGEL